MKKWHVWAFSLLVLVISHKVAADQTPIAWGDWGYLAPSNQVGQLAPNIVKATELDTEMASRLSARLQRSLETALSSRTDLKFVPRGVEYLQDTYVLFFSVISDYVDYRRVDEVAVEIYTIEAAVLVVNVSQQNSRQRIVNNIPVSVKYATVHDPNRTPEDRARIFAKMLVDPDPSEEMEDLVAKWTEEASKLQIREKSVWLRVAPVELSSSARELLQHHAANPDQARVIEQMPYRAASTLEWQVAKGLNIPVVPFGASSASQKLVLSISDRRAALDFNPPAADRSMVLVVDELRFVETSQVSQGGIENRGQTFAARFLFRVVKGEDTNDREATLLELPLKIVQSDLFARDKQFDVPQEFGRLIALAGRDVGEAFSRADGKWFEKARSAQERRKPKEVEKAVKQLRDRFIQ